MSTLLTLSLVFVVVVNAVFSIGISYMLFLYMQEQQEKHEETKRQIVELVELLEQNNNERARQILEKS